MTRSGYRHLQCARSCKSADLVPGTYGESPDLARLEVSSIVRDHQSHEVGDTCDEYRIFTLYMIEPRKLGEIEGSAHVTCPCQGLFQRIQKDDGFRARVVGKLVADELEI